MLSPAASPVAPATPAQAGVASVFDLPSMARDGDADTPLATSGPGFDQTGGASYCQVIDLADWDHSLAKNAPGQSGQPGSAYYGNLLEAWRDGEYFPLSFGREAVEAVARERLLLVPAGDGAQQGVMR
jgi:penicillin amidase